MSYSVLARKWRPKNFSELVGQQHVMQALANALDQQRLHHAYLFTGTRGVGKTTIARIFAKALNCETGISSTPCGHCEVCRSIDEGRFIDLIEVDAASKTKVDDTREILENVQFAPTQGRFKVYLIDEVHMLSKSSFNALLKTLEEPPEHVKFLLATTDPHKLLNTVLSRCLQFNLMRLTQVQIQNHLQYILQQENIPYEESALALIAKSADGSARDALSLLDQAIAYGAGKIEFQPVQTMLGLVDQQFVLRILQALAEDSSAAIKDVMQELAMMGVDYDALLASLSETLHEITYFQLFGEAANFDSLPQELLQALSQALSPERVQTLYQISLLTKQDMQLAPDSRIGFEMGLMRMFAFDPQQLATSAVKDGGAVETVTPVSEVDPSAALASLKSGLQNFTEQKSSAAPEVKAQVLSPSVEQSANSAAPVASETAQQVSPQSEQDFGLSSGDVDPQESVLETLDPQVAVAQMSSARNLVGKEITPKKPVVPESNEVQMPQENGPSLAEQMLAGFDSLGKPDAPQNAEPVEQPKSDLEKQVAQMGMGAMERSAPVADNQADFSPISNQPEIPASSHTELSAPVDVFSEVPPWVNEPIIEPSAGHSFDEVSQSFADNAAGFGSAAPFEPTYAENSSDAAIQNDPSLDMPSASMPSDDTQNLSNPHETAFEMSSVPAVQISASAQEKMQLWQELIEGMQLKGMVLEIASQSVLLSKDASQLQIAVNPEQDFSRQHVAMQQFNDEVGSRLGLELQVLDGSMFDREQLTPRQLEARRIEERQKQAENAIAQDPVLHNLMSLLNLQVLPDSVKPL
ncbi:DNA polymerase III subunit gamma/tau [Thiomicrorhabdus sp. 6S3-12]|uniref:DNA polymerase III subunit gamma/tau n=1 Tax=Thiomicrorhabdus sp. 6S3-12 TaxID=2819681 RepID=UPI001AAC5A1B|nr:DNA polymerase III subunit gamma/tau [Thiomicrorhabdus sp. 6S3-12]MBO1923750.1 DNA polymerase III subunit gamma/tau [Thiomicrorhabdus sp. 6S3-12]